MVLLKNFLNIFSVSDLRNKLFFTLGVLIVYRFGHIIPIIGIDVSAVTSHMDKAQGYGAFYAFLDMFSGGALRQCALFALGVGPYITASIVMQFLGMSVPYLEQLLKEGEYGRRLVNQYTRYLAFTLSLVQGLIYALALEKQGLVLQSGWSFRLLCILSVSTGSMLVMWFGEQLEIFGLGRGSSMIIFAGIVAMFPGYVLSTIASIKEGLFDPIVALVLLAVFIAIITAIVLLEKGQRKIPIQYARRVVGQKVYGAQHTYIPFKINTVGVMPVIFAQTFINFPMFALTFLASRFEFAKKILEHFSYAGVMYNVLSFALIIFFTFAYTFMQYNPDDLADNIKKGGGFIPGKRPGRQTAEYFNYVLMRLAVVGALYLGVLAVFPNLLGVFFGKLPFYVSGTALLIAVGVALEFAAQVESYLIEYKYEGFLVSGRLKGRGGR